MMSFRGTMPARVESRVTAVAHGRNALVSGGTDSRVSSLASHDCMMCDERLSGSSMLGLKVGSFRIESRIGAGSLGIVYRGVNEKNGRLVAIKVARDVREIAQVRLLHSGEILSRLHHQNIVRFEGMGRFHGTTYLAMEFVPGLTVANELLERGPLPWPEVIDRGLQICEALRHLHESNFLHRNLKPAHLILTDEGRLKLIGFGLTRSLDATALPSGGVAVGTPGYMAPEQICAATAIDNRADLYALGVVLWNLLTALSPYQEPNESADRRGGAALAFAHLTQPRQRPSARIKDIPKALDDLIVQLMDPTPQKRPSDAAAVARVLRDCSF
jgi:serine/threonine-protein kinase